MAVRALQPTLKIIAFSAESRFGVISDLFERCQINGYVRKARKDGQHFKQAIQAVASGQTYRSPDIAIIELLVTGVPKKDSPVRLKQQGLSPSSLSSVEKKLGYMKSMLGFNNNAQLIAYCKDSGII